MDVNNNEEAEYILENYGSSKDYSVDIEMENIESVHISNYNGNTTIGYIGSVYAETEEENYENLNKEDMENSEDSELEDIIKIISQDQNFAIESQKEYLGIEDEKINDLEFQIPNLDTAIEPVRNVLDITRLTSSGKKIAQVIMTTYVYRGNKWSGTNGTTYYNYVMATMQVAPTSDYYVENFTGRIKSQNENTSIVEAVYLDDNCSSQSYSLAVGGSAWSDGKTQVTYNKTLTNSYSTTAMDIKEKFSHQGDSCGYVDWYVDPCKNIDGQARVIAPAAITKATNATTHIKTAIRDITLHGWIDWNVSGEAMSTIVRFK